jgi:uncharacterized protein (DUF1800 family)
MASVNSYSLPLDAKAAEHLLRRTMFGATRKDIATLTGKTAAQAVDMLLADQPTPAPPIDVSALRYDPTGKLDPSTVKTWVNNTTRSINEGAYNNYFRAWWAGLMITQPISIREKMVLFWQNHFVSTYTTVQDSRYIYKQNALLRRYALGNVKNFVRDITIDAAMLRYLNGNSNRVGAPQENYGRELQELFTIGKGPEIAPFNYTNYTEDDVRAAAKVLTGWRDRNDTVEGYFTANLHDTTDKRFSSAYQNTVIKGRTGVNAGMDELNDMLTMIFNQAETARFLVRKLYRFFVNFDITPEIEKDIIEPIAATLRRSNFEVKPALRQMLLSEHFFDENTRGAIIKTPLDLILGAVRQFDITMPDATTQPEAYYAVMDRFRGLAAQQQQDLHEQPNVAGWPAYYQEPSYYQMWVNTATMPNRTNYFTNTLNRTMNVNVNGKTQPIPMFDSVAYVQKFPNPEDPYKLIDNITANFFAVDLTEEAKVELVKETLQQGVPDYEWTTQWNAFIADNGRTASLRAKVKEKLDRVVNYLMGLAEYQVY